MSDFAWFALCLGLVGALVAMAVELRRRPAPKAQGEPSRPVVAAEPALVAPNQGTVEILERMGEGVLLLDREMRPLFANSVARDMLGFQRALPERLPSEEVLAAARRALVDEEIEEILQIWFPLPMNLRVRATLLAEASGVIVVLQDVTQEVLAQRIRREFVAHASHELKSPVASLQTLAEAVQNAVGDDPDTVLMFSQRMVVEADRLGRLVRDLLDLSRLEDPTNIPQEPADLSSVAHRELDSVRESVEAKDITLAERIDADIWLKGDNQQLGLLIKNLLENAIRYTSAGGNISLEVFREGTNAYVVVRDDGIGIPLEAHSRVFERFYRVDRARARDKGGTGLGLAIVKHVAEMHGGKVTVRSDLGEGSIFTAQLPAIQTDKQNAPVESLAG